MLVGICTRTDLLRVRADQFDLNATNPGGGYRHGNVHDAEEVVRADDAEQRAGVLALIVVQAALAAFAQRDLSSRSAAELRGPKLLWRFATLNTIGVLAYIFFGRQPASGS